MKAPKLWFTREQLRNSILSDPDINCDAGILHPEAPLNQTEEGST